MTIPVIVQHIEELHKQNQELMTHCHKLENDIAELRNQLGVERPPTVEKSCNDTPLTDRQRSRYPL